MTAADAAAGTVPGRIFVVSAPSGAGKTTLCAAMRRRFPMLRYSVSTTTRPPRPGERDGVDYHFTGTDAFETGISEGAWAEWARVHGNYYGTSAAVLQAAVDGGRFILLDIDVQGAAQIVERFPDSVTIFIMPPSRDVLRQRLAGRGTNDPEDVARRMAAAETEMAASGRYRHIVVNDDLDDAIAELTGVFGRYLPRTAAPSDEGPS